MQVWKVSPVFVLGFFLQNYFYQYFCEMSDEESLYMISRADAYHHQSSDRPY